MPRKKASPVESVHPLDKSALTRTAAMAELFGVSAVTVNNLARDGVLRIQKPGTFYVYDSLKNYIAHLRKGNKSKHGNTESSQELRDALVREQGRKEKAVASLKELELRMQEQNLVPESIIVERLNKLLLPLRRLLDALPRACASHANPAKPMVAEMAIRNALDDRVFTELSKILEQMKQEDNQDQ